MKSWNGRWFLSLFGVLCFSVCTRAQDVPVEKLRKELELLQMERDALVRETVQLRKRIDQLHKDTRTELAEARLEIDVLKAKLDRLTDCLAEYEKAHKAPPKPAAAPMTAEARGLVGGTPVANPLPRVSRKPGDPIKGKVTEISEKSALVGLSLGSEDGIRAGQELECYRLGLQDAPGKNQPIYVGKMRIIRVTPTESVATYVPLQGLERRPMVGDEVASELLVK